MVAIIGAIMGLTEGGEIHCGGPKVLLYLGRTLLSAEVSGWCSGRLTAGILEIGESDLLENASGVT